MVCCDAMKTMIEDGTIQPFTAFGQETVQMWPTGKNREIRHYNLKPNFKLITRLVHFLPWKAMIKKYLKVVILMYIIQGNLLIRTM
jgi:hypothetical protein